MGVALAAAADGGRYRRPMGFYERREKRDQSLNLRITKSLKDSLGRLAKAWEFLDSLEDGAEPFDPKSDPNVSDVAVRLLTQSAAAAWKEIGGFEPKTDEQWAEFFKAARAAHKKQANNGK